MELLDLLCMWGTDRNETGGDAAVYSINSSQYSATLLYTSMLSWYCWNSQIDDSVVKINSWAGHFISSSYMWHCHVKRSRLCSRLFMSRALRLWQHINLPPQPRMPPETRAETNDDPGSSTSAETYPAPARRRCRGHEAQEMHERDLIFKSRGSGDRVVTYRGKQGSHGDINLSRFPLKSFLLLGIVNSFM